MGRVSAGAVGSFKTGGFGAGFWGVSAAVLPASGGWDSACNCAEAQLVAPNKSKLAMQIFRILGKEFIASSVPVKLSLKLRVFEYKIRTFPKFTKLKEQLMPTVGKIECWVVCRYVPQEYPRS